MNASRYYSEAEAAHFFRLAFFVCSTSRAGEAFCRFRLLARGAELLRVIRYGTRAAIETPDEAGRPMALMGDKGFAVGTCVITPFK